MEEGEKDRGESAEQDEPETQEAAVLPAREAISLITGGDDSSDQDTATPDT